MQFQVPQFIETEDKIVGPLSIRQFVYVSAGATLSFLLYFTVQTWLWAFLSIFILGVAAALALVKIGGRPLPHIALSAAKFYWFPQTYVWQSTKVARAEKKEDVASEESSLEKIVSGIALRGAWQKLQTGGKMSGAQFTEKPGKQRMEIFRKMSGERQVARRVDYR